MKIYKHINNTDVAAHFLRVIFIAPKNGYKVKVSWLNIVNPKRIFPCGITEEIFIPMNKIKEWKLYDV